ncbi:MAG: hypothetical protein AAF639_25725 [Chloroflexota bacterium]
MQQQNQTHSISDHCHNHFWVRYMVVFSLAAIIVLRMQLAFWLVPLTEPMLANLNTPTDNSPGQHITTNAIVDRTNTMTITFDMGMIAQSNGASQ